MLSNLLVCIKNNLSLSSIKKIKYIPAILPALLLLTITGCSGGSKNVTQTIEYTKPNLVEEGKTYDIEINQKLEESIITAKGKIQFTPSCEYFINVNAYNDVSNEYVFTLSKNANGTGFIQGREPGSSDFIDWGDYRDPLTPRALIMLYPALILNGEEDGYLCTIDKLYNFLKDSSSEDYEWDMEFLQEYTNYSAESWRNMIVNAFDLSDNNKQILNERLSGILVPDYTFALESFPTVTIKNQDNSYLITLSNPPDLSLEIKLTESASPVDVKPLNVLDFPSYLSRDMEGLTESQILDQFKTEN